MYSLGMLGSCLLKMFFSAISLQHTDPVRADDVGLSIHLQPGRLADGWGSGSLAHSDSDVPQFGKPHADKLLRANHLQWSVLAAIFCR